MGIYLVLMNALGLVLMFADKQFARKKKRRIPESTLLLTAMLGGSVGSFVGIHLFRHKTRKRRFYLGIPLILVGQLLVSVFFFCFER